MATPGADPGRARAAAEAAERAYTSMDEAHRLVARGLLLRLVPLGDGSGERRLPLTDLQDPDRAAALAHVLNVLERAHVVAVHGPEIMLADQALADAWPRLRSWVEQEKPVLATAHRAIDAAHAWRRDGYPDAGLYRGLRLRTALAAEESAGDLLDPTTRQFLRTSRERHRARRRRLLRRRIALVGVLILIAGTITAVSVIRQREAEHDAALRSRQLVAAAKAATADPDAALQLAVAAYRASPTPEATRLMYGMLNKPADRVVGRTGRPILRVAAQRQGSLAAAVSANGSLRIWSLADPGAPRLQATVRTPPSAMAFAPRGRVLAGPCTNGGLCLWNLADPRRPSVFSRLPVRAHPEKTGVTRMAISPDGTLLAAATLSGRALLWSIARPEHPRLLDVFTIQAGGPLNDHLAAVAFAPRGKVLAFTVQRNGAAGQAGHGATELWNVADAAHPSSVAKIAGGYQAVAFNPAGNLLAAGGNMKVALWRLDRAGHPAPVNAQPFCAGNATGGTMSIESVAFAPDGGRLSYSGEDIAKGNTHAAICTLDVSPTSLYAKSPAAQSVPTAYGTSDLAYTPGGALFTGGNDGVTRLWRSPMPQVGGLRIADGTSWDVSQDGHLLAAAAQGLTVGIWDISSPGHPVVDAVLPFTPELVFFVNRRALITVAPGGAVRLWNLADPRHPAQAASLGTASPLAPGGFSSLVTTDSANDLISVLDYHGRLHLWKITRTPGAREVGSIPATDPAHGYAGVLADGRTALSQTATAITWWNIADPAHPVRGGTSPLSDGLGTSDGGGSLLANANRPGGKNTNHRTLKLFDVDRGRPRSAVTVTTSAASALRLSPDARLLAATGTADTSLTLWDVSDPRHPRRRSELTVPGITDLAFSSAHRRMADWNRTTVQLWDIRHPAGPVSQASLVPPAQTKAGEGVAGARFSANGKTIFVATGNSLFLYDADPAALANRLCSIAGRPISRAQWRQHASGVPYANPCPR